MEKVFISPVAKEILIKGNTAKEGPVDLFSYDGNGNGRTLGSLYVVGNIQGGADESSDDIDVGYVLNLVASLAKREYYSNPDADPKEAFAAALKKINGVVEEFFKKKDTKINIGIFAIASDQIHISKLGKFKIYLARDGKNIDILNNIQLFNKETLEEKEFSNIISGKIHEGDRILAFYPNRGITTREKTLKDNLAGSNQEEFAAHLASIKEAKPDFSCVALHIDIQKGTEAATARRVQPAELKKEEETEASAPAAAPVQLAAAPTSKAEPEEEDEQEKDVESEEPEQPVAQTIAHRPVEPPMPKIIPTEFARAKRELALAKHVRRLKNMNLAPRGKAVTLGGIAAVALIAIFALKSFVFVSASTRQINSIISDAENNIKTAQTKVQNSDLVGARNLLVSSLAAITDAESKNGANKKADDMKSQIMHQLDTIDQATDATVNVVATIPADSGDAKLLAAAGNNFYAYLAQKDGGAIIKVNSDGSIATTTSVNNISPKEISASNAYVALLDPTAKKITSLSIGKSTLSTSTFSSDDLVDSEIYQDNLYGLTASGITKITDAALGHTAATAWLKDSLPASATKLAVDGNIYVLSSNGMLTTYYKGTKKNETNTSVTPESGSLLLTTDTSPNLFLVNTSAGRIYIISKQSGSVSKTLKVSAAIDSAALGPNDTLFILSDNKIWQVK